MTKPPDHRRTPFVLPILGNFNRKSREERAAAGQDLLARLGRALRFPFRLSDS